MEKNMKKNKYIYIYTHTCIAEPFCWTPEMLQMNYISIKIKNKN